MTRIDKEIADVKRTEFWFFVFIAIVMTLSAFVYGAHPFIGVVVGFAWIMIFGMNIYYQVLIHRKAEGKNLDIEINESLEKR